MTASLEPKTWDQCAADALRELAECTAYDGVTEVMVAIPNALWDRVLAMAAPTQREGATTEELVAIGMKAAEKVYTETQAARCPAVHQGMRCTLKAGHKGEHNALMPTAPDPRWFVPAPEAQRDEPCDPDGLATYEGTPK